MLQRGKFTGEHDGQTWDFAGMAAPLALVYITRMDSSMKFQMAFVCVRDVRRF